MNDFKKSYSDEIDFAYADQLHHAVLHISKTCFDLKKLCVTILGLVMVFLTKINNNMFTSSIFIVGITLSIGFWVSDATAYYYQRRLRKRIKQHFQNITQRNGGKKESIHKEACFISSMFNLSMIIYYLLLILFVGGWIVYACD